MVEETWRSWPCLVRFQLVDQFRLGAGHVDRILKGEKPADLPVQAPNKYELVPDLKTTKAFGLTSTNLARAPMRQSSRSTGRPQLHSALNALRLDRTRGAIARE